MQVSNPMAPAFSVVLLLALGSAGCREGTPEGPQAAGQGGERMATQIETGSLVSLEFTLKLEDDTVVASNVGGDPLVYTQGAGELVPGLERALQGMKVGESKEITLSPDEGFGPVRPEAIQRVPRERVPEDARHVGAELQGQAPDGTVLRARVVEVQGDTLVVDFNHPLAGQTLVFDVKVLDVRAPQEPIAP